MATFSITFRLRQRIPVAGCNFLRICGFFETGRGVSRLRPRTGVIVMTFKVYSGPPGADTVSPFDKDRLLYKELPSLDEALSWAGHVKETGRVALLIEDEGGTRLDKREIAAALGHRDARTVRGAP
jgi:hypothetical protein